MASGMGSYHLSNRCCSLVENMAYVVVLSREWLDKGVLLMRQAVFRYPPEFVTLSKYTAHAGQIVKVVRALRADEYEVDSQMERMFKIRAFDGWEGAAFESELVEV